MLLQETREANVHRGRRAAIARGVDHAARHARRATWEPARRRRATLGPILALLLALLGAHAPRASAQTATIVPEPVTTPELRPIIETLRLSDQQALTLLELHDAYKERYNQFQDTDVKKLLDQLIEIGLRFAGGRVEIPERKELEGIVSDFKKLLAKSQSLDRGFFSEIGGMLSEDQLPRLERARINRELKVYREILGGVGEMNRGAGVNLAEMTRGLDLNPQEREQVEPVLAEYESGLLSRSRTVFNVLTEVTTAILDLIDELNIRNKTLEELAMMGQNPDPGLLEMLRNRFDEASKPIQEAAYDVSQLNMRTYRRVVPLVRPEIADELRDRYFRRAYREVYEGPPVWLARYRHALDLELTDDQRLAIETQRDSFLAQLNNAVDSAVNVVETSRKYKTFRQFSQQEPDPAQEKVDDFRTRRTGIGESALASLNGILGETMVAQLDERIKAEEQRTGRDDQPSRRMVTVGVGPGGGDIEVEMSEAEIAELPPEFAPPPLRAVASDPYLPQPMGVREFERLLEAVGDLGMGEDDRTVAMTLFDAYRAEYESQRSAELDIQKAGEAPTYAETAKARQARIDQLDETDRGLFDDIAVLVDEGRRSAIDEARGMRRRAVTTEIARNMGRFFGDEEAFIDLPLLVETSELSAAARQSAHGALREYDARVGSLLAKRLDAARDVQRRSEAMQRASRRDAAGGNQAREFATEKWRESRQRMNAANEKITAINREMLASAIGTLDADAAWQLRLGYNQAAYPEIFRDERSAEKAIQGALALNDLNDFQRERINEVAADYRAAFFGLCEQMVALRVQRDLDMFGGGIPQKADIDREIELEKMRFRRDELSARAKMRLSLILNDEQSKILPELQSR